MVLARKSAYLSHRYYNHAAAQSSISTLNEQSKQADINFSTYLPAPTFTLRYIRRAKEIAVKLGFKDSKAQAEAGDIMQKLYKLFKETDATQVEINPLSETAEGVMCMDAKLGFDENAEFRQEKIFKLRDLTQEDAAEVCTAISNSRKIPRPHRRGQH
jgi:hypothetical protein